jgi:hypothetical protein
MSEPSASRRRPRWALVVALLLTGTAVTVGLLTRASDRPAGEPDAGGSRTRLDRVDLSDLPVSRGPFCDVLDQRHVEDALGAPVAGTAHYDSGARVRMSAAVWDLSHEWGCTFRAASGAQARAWVFAEPVSAGVARGIVRDARAGRGCRPVAAAPAFGAPTDAARCPIARGGRSVTLRGLFGDAWLTCQLSTPRSESEPETVRRAEQWCVRVATAMGARS